MRLTYTSIFIADTLLVDDYGRQLYATTSSVFGRKTEVTKFGQTWTSNFATLRFHKWQSDNITVNGQRHRAKSYVTKPSWWSRRRVFTSATGHTYEWVPKGNAWRLCLLDGREVGRSHSLSLGLMGQKHKPYLEFDDSPYVQGDLDELVATFIYVHIRREKDLERVADIETC